MPVDGENTERLPKPDVKETSLRIRTLTREMAEAGKLLEDLTDRQRGEVKAVQSAFEREDGDRRERFKLAHDRIGTRYFVDRRSLKGKREDRRGRITRAVGRVRRELNGVLQADQRRTDAEFAALREVKGAEIVEKRKPLEAGLKRWAELLPALREDFQATADALTKFAAHHGIDPVETTEWSGFVPENADVEPMAAEAHETFDAVRREAVKSGDTFGSSFARTGRIVLGHALILILGIGGVMLAIRLGVEPDRVAPALGAVPVLSGLLILLTFIVRRRHRRTLRDLTERTTHQASRFEKHAAAAHKSLESLHTRSAEAHAMMLDDAQQRLRSASLSRTSDTRRRLADLERRAERATARAVDLHAASVLAIDQAEDRDLKEHRAAHEAEVEEARKENERHREEIDSRRRKLERELEQRREQAVKDFERFAAGATRAVAKIHQPWDRIDPSRIVLPEGFPEFVPFGRLRVSLDGLLTEAHQKETEFLLPVAATFPEHGSLLVRHPPAKRDQALEILSNSVLRALASFPAGKVRLTIFDPVGLGQSFSALMHLADHDEDLVNHRIWTETVHLERRLADLTEHIEKVIQKYLRNKFLTIGEYNEEAGELQEPYHFLVIADFPTAFNELAAERLASIVASGPRCGVYTFIAHDVRQHLMPPVDLGLLRRNGPALIFEGDVCRLDGEAAEHGEFLPETPPDADSTRKILDSIGRQSVDAAHIELPFSAITPRTEEEVWSGSTRNGVRVAIGRTGAERLQYLDLGRGTAQHALVAGRTGSGKSTLFHVMITNLSLWFSPNEIEFYLIDFKKGVEFKPFASFGLPHARVVAIESDREFGLSVLRAVDAELARRGDLFRAQGVQDLASYRGTAGAEIMPRTILLIDEFQEFFTDDDSVAHDAALLLDRFVRQGRAFGIHVVLGSQTLSGIYTLARGTLGQMGVRVALQCNESDSYLILSEDNGVARLLSRPGEAIYNDKSGLIEGNNPFQVVWLTEEEKHRHLPALAARAAASPDLPTRPTVVFEGNQPADIEENHELMALLEDGPGRDHGDDRVWIGEPNAIKGPTELRFMAASGSNMMIVGQRRESAFAMMSAAILALTAQHDSGDLRIVILDGGGHEPEFAARFDGLLTAFEGRAERYDMRTAPDAVTDIAERIKAREEGTEACTPIYIFAFGLQRLRVLRREDEFAMPFGDEETVSTGEQFATILTEGPAQHVHTIVWCDTVPNLQRTLSRKAMREFDMRVLFQMSAADSSEMIESSAANRLGLTNALLAVESQGTFEKFRPYAIPTAEMLLRGG
jgi:DNA segregation ATPase FtsK/SpoIIIE, S-DNA-T family